MSSASQRGDQRPRKSNPKRAAARRPAQPVNIRVSVPKSAASAARKRGRNNPVGRQLAASRSYMATDRLNSSRVVVNSSVVEDKFQLRREKVANVSGTSAFTLAQSLYVNPGNTVLFPIFSQIAATYEMYRVNTLRFVFETDAYTATNGTASAGKVILATNFDPDDSTFAGDTQMENYVGSVKGPPYAPVICHDLKHSMHLNGRRRQDDLALKNYFVYSSGNQESPLTGAGKFYDIGLFQLATSGNAVTTEIGELYVEYSFTMIRPKQQTPALQNAAYAHIVESPAASAAAAGSAFLGTTGGSLRAGSTIPCVSTSSTFTIPTFGRYIIAMLFTGSVTGNVTVAYGSSIATAALLVDSASGASGTVSSNKASYLVVVDVSSAGTGAANTVTLSVLTSLAAGTADIFISQISSGATLATGMSARLLALEQALSDQRSYATRVFHEEKFDEVDEDYVGTPGALSASTQWTVTEALRKLTGATSSMHPSASEADAHNKKMHASNGNGTAVPTLNMRHPGMEIPGNIPQPPPPRLPPPPPEAPEAKLARPFHVPGVGWFVRDPQRGIVSA